MKLHQAIIAVAASVGLCAIPTTVQAFAQPAENQPSPAPAKVTCEANPKVNHPVLSNIVVKTDPSGAQYITGNTSDNTKPIFLGYHTAKGAWKVIKLPPSYIDTEHCSFYAYLNDGVQNDSPIYSGPWNIDSSGSKKYQKLVEKFDATKPNKATDVKATFHHVSGKAEANATALVNYQSDDNKWYTVEAPVDSKGMFSIELKDHFIKDGFKANVTVEDPTGNRSDQKAMSNLVRHYADPKVTENTPFTVAGTADKWKTVELLYITDTGQSKTVTTKTDKDGKFTFNLNPNAQQGNTVTLTVKDNNGQESSAFESKQFDFALGDAETYTPVAAPTILKASPFEASGVVEPDKKVFVTYQDESTETPQTKTLEATVNNDGKWTVKFETPLPSDIPITAYAQDAKGYQSKTVNGVIAIPVPKVTYLSPFALEGTVKPGYDVYMFYMDNQDNPQDVTVKASDVDENGHFTVKFNPEAKGGSQVTLFAQVPNTVDLSDITEETVPESEVGAELFTPEVPTITYVSTISVSGTAAGVSNVVLTYTGVDNEQHTVKAPVVDGKFTAQFDPTAKSGTNVVAQGESTLGDLSENSQPALVPDAKAGDELIKEDVLAPEVPTLDFAVLFDDNSVTVYGYVYNTPSVVVTYTGIDGQEHTVEAPVNKYGRFAAFTEPPAKEGTFVVAQGKNALGVLSAKSKRVLVASMRSDADVMSPAPPVWLFPQPAQPATPKNPVVKHTDSKVVRKKQMAKAVKKTVKTLASTGVCDLPVMLMMVVTLSGAAVILLTRRKMGDRA